MCNSSQPRRRRDTSHGGSILTSEISERQESSLFPLREPVVQDVPTRHWVSWGRALPAPLTGNALAPAPSLSYFSPLVLTYLYVPLPPSPAILAAQGAFCEMRLAVLCSCILKFINGTAICFLLGLFSLWGPLRSAQGAVRTSKLLLLTIA